MPEHAAFCGTTLCGDAQQEGISLSVTDELVALPILDDPRANFVEDD